LKLEKEIYREVGRRSPELKRRKSIAKRLAKTIIISYFIKKLLE